MFLKLLLIFCSEVDSVWLKEHSTYGIDCSNRQKIILLERFHSFWLCTWENAEWKFYSDMILHRLTEVNTFWNKKFVFENRLKSKILSVWHAALKRSQNIQIYATRGCRSEPHHFTIVSCRPRCLILWYSYLKFVILVPFGYCLIIAIFK